MVPIIAENPPINIPLFTVSLSLIFLGTLGSIVPLTTWYQDLLPEGEKGKFAGIYNITHTVSMIVGTFSAGIVATLLKDVVINPLAWIFTVVPIFFIACIPIFLSVKDKMQKVNKTE